MSSPRFDSSGQLRSRQSEVPEFHGKDRIRQNNENDSNEFSNDVQSQIEEALLLCEGNQNPIKADRSSQLAVECWNLRKTVLELNSQLLKLRNDNKTQRHLVKNLQSLLNSTQSENLSRSRENNQLKGIIVERERKMEELSSQTTTLTNLSMKQRRSIGLLQHRLQEIEKGSALRNSSSEELIKQLQQQLKEKAAEYEAKFLEKDKDLRDTQQENISLSTVMNHANMKIEEIEKRRQELEQQVASLQMQAEKDQILFHNQLEKVYEELHEKLEIVTSERQDYYNKYLEKEHENSQLMSYILKEGLQLPKIQKLNN